MRRLALCACLVAVAALAGAPRAARAQADTNCPNAVAPVAEYLKIAKADPKNSAAVSAAALRAAEAFNQCGRDAIRNHERSLAELANFHDRYQYAEVREAQFRVVAARNLFLLDDRKEAQSEFETADKLASDVADYTNNNSPVGNISSDANAGTQSVIVRTDGAINGSRFKDAAVAIRDQARAALAAIKEARQSPSAPAPASTPLP
jgi:hypothetical protein